MLHPFTAVFISRSSVDVIVRLNVFLYGKASAGKLCLLKIKHSFSRIMKIAPRR